MPPSQLSFEQTRKKDARAPEKPDFSHLKPPLYKTQPLGARATTGFFKLVLKLGGLFQIPYTAKRVSDGGLEKYVCYINIIADFMPEAKVEKLGKRMDKIVVINS